MKHRDTYTIRIIAVSFLFFFMLFSKTGQGQAATAVWPMTSNGNATVTGNVTAAATTGGPGISSYAVYTSCGGWSSNWSLQSTGSEATKYAQFSISPAAGYNLTVNTF